MFHIHTSPTISNTRVAFSKRTRPTSTSVFKTTPASSPHAPRFASSHASAKLLGAYIFGIGSALLGVHLTQPSPVQTPARQTANTPTETIPSGMVVEAKTPGLFKLDLQRNELEFLEAYTHRADTVLSYLEALHQDIQETTAVTEDFKAGVVERLSRFKSLKSQISPRTRAVLENWKYDDRASFDPEQQKALAEYIIQVGAKGHRELTFIGLTAHPDDQRFLRDNLWQTHSGFVSPLYRGLPHDSLAMLQLRVTRYNKVAPAPYQSLIGWDYTQDIEETVLKDKVFGGLRQDWPKMYLP